MAFDIVQHVSVEMVLPRLVVCQHCGSEFVYEMRGQAEATQSILERGVGGARDEATEAAYTNLLEYFKNRCDPVPCPNCHLYQSHMFQEAGMRRYQWVLIFLVPALLAAGLGLSVALFDIGGHQATGAIAAVAGVLMFLAVIGAQSYLIRRYDPNTQPQRTRVALAAERAMGEAEFHRRRTASTAERYSMHGRAASAGGGEPEPFVVDVWVCEEQVTAGETVAVELPDGGTAHLRLDPRTETAAVYRFDSTNRKQVPFLARVQVFNRNPEIILKPAGPRTGTHGS